MKHINSVRSQLRSMMLGPIVLGPMDSCSGSVARFTASGLVNCVANILTHSCKDHPSCKHMLIFVQALIMICTQVNCVARILAAAGMLEERSLSESPAVRNAL